ncbi:MAG: AraC family transcriptional regulator [Planctomycetota bacterium]
MSEKIASRDIGPWPDAGDRDDLCLPPRQDGRLYFADGHPARAMPRPHAHDEWECNAVLHGTAAYVVEGRRVDLRIDSLVMLLPTQRHILIDVSDDFRMWVVVFRQRVARRLAGDEGYEPWRRWLRGASPAGPVHREIGERATAAITPLLEELYQTDPTRHLGRLNAGIAWAAAAMWSAYLDAPDLPAGSHLHPAVDEALAWLSRHAHTPEADDLDALAHRCHVSRSHLSRLFRQQTGRTLTDFRNARRVDRFARLVGRGGKTSLTQAAYAAGFGSYAQAFRVIRAVTGRSPRRWIDDLG